MKAVTNIIVAKDIGTGNAGFIRILKDDMSALVAGETIADSPVIYIEQDIGNTDDVVTSFPIRGANVTKYSGQSYAAPIVQVTTIDPISAANDTLHRLYIVVKSEKEQFQIRRAYEFTTDASATTTELVTGFTNLINADSNLDITATGSTTLILTSDTQTTEAAAYFDVSLGEGWSSSATNVETTRPDPGIGEFWMVRQLEDDGQGYINQVLFPDTKTNYTISGTNYDIYVIAHDLSVEVQSADTIQRSKAITYIVVVAGSSTFGQSTFESILNGWMASTPGAFGAVNL